MGHLHGSHLVPETFVPSSFMATGPEFSVPHLNIPDGRAPWPRPELASPRVTPRRQAIQPNHPRRDIPFIDVGGVLTSLRLERFVWYRSPMSVGTADAQLNSAPRSMESLTQTGV